MELKCDFLGKMNSGIVLKKLDKKLERTLLHSYRKVRTLVIEKSWSIQVPICISLFFSEAYNSVRFHLLYIFLFGNGI